MLLVVLSLPSEERGVRGEDGGEVELPDARHDEADAAHPLVEVSHDPAKGMGEFLCYPIFYLKFYWIEIVIKALSRLLDHFIVVEGQRHQNHTHEETI